MVVKLNTILLILLFPLFSIAQEANEPDWFPKFDNEFPTKFLTFTVDGLLDYTINSISDIEEIGNGSAEISGNKLMTFDINFPIILGEKLLLTGGAKYSDEQFYFEKHEPTTYPLYESLNDRNLRKLGGSINGLVHIKNNRSFIFRTSFYLAGDFHRNNENFSAKKLLKSSLAIGYGIKKNKNTFHAFGIYAGYTFGRPSIYPAYALSKRFNNGIGLEAALPQRVKIWKKMSDNTYLYSNAKITGNSYTIQLEHPVFEKNGSLQLRQSYLLASLGVTQKLSKWIWSELEIGYSHNINFNISESDFTHNGVFPKANKNYLIESDVSGAPFAMISLFLSPPQDFIDKLLNK